MEVRDSFGKALRFVRQRRGLTQEDFDAFAEENLFEYQKHLRLNIGQHVRNILKSRQIGATFYFVREALIDALETGRNQIFLSASKAQAHVFKQYIIQFAKEEGVELKGDPMVLPNGAHMYFLGTNARTAQSYHGNIYMDEYFWIHGFADFRNVASGMAMHKKWRQTYFSTPSSLSHPAYKFWSGEEFNKGRPKADQIKFDLSHAHLMDGKLGGDGQWRQLFPASAGMNRFAKWHLSRQPSVPRVRGDEPICTHSFPNTRCCSPRPRG